MQFRSTLLLAAVLASAFTPGHAYADDHKAGNLQIANAYARPTVPNQPSGAAYLSIENNGKAVDTLVAASSPVAGKVEIHSMQMDGNVMKMRAVKGVDIKPSAKVVMQPGDGYHLMLIGLKQPLKVGEKIPLTLTFKKAGKIEISARVEAKQADGNAAKDADAHKHH